MSPWFFTSSTCLVLDASQILHHADLHGVVCCVGPGDSAWLLTVPTAASIGSIFCRDANQALKRCSHIAHTVWLTAGHNRCCHIRAAAAVNEYTETRADRHQGNPSNVLESIMAALNSPLRCSCTSNLAV